MHAVRVGRGDIVYCIVTCGAYDYDRSRPNPTLAVAIAFSDHVHCTQLHNKKCN